MKIKSVDSFYSLLKIKTQQFSDKVNTYPAVKYVKRKEAQLAEKIDAMPKTVAMALHLIPVVNIFAHYIKEKGLDNRLPALHKHTKAEYKCECLDKQVKELRDQKKSYDKAIKDMTEQRRELLAQPQDNTKSFKGLKSRLGRKIAGWQVSESKIQDYKKEVDKTKKQLDKLVPQLVEAQAEKRTHKADLSAAEANGEVEATHKERKLLRNTYRVGLAVLTAAAVAAVALSAFSVVPAVVGFGALLVVGAAVGMHIAKCMSYKWEVDGLLSFKNASLDD